MTDRLAPNPTPAPPVDLRVTDARRGRLLGRLLDGGRYLEVAERGRVTVFDLWESARLGRCVVWDGDGDEGDEGD